MIGLVGVQPPPGDGRGLVTLEALPDPPAARLSGFVVRCAGPAEAKETLGWFDRVRTRRPRVPLGLVAEPRHCVDAVGSSAHPTTFILPPDQLSAGGVPAFALREIRQASVEGRVLDKLLARCGDASPALEETLVALVGRAVSGGTAKRAAGDLGVSVETVRRRLRGSGLHPGRLATEIRLRAFELRIALGEDRGTAVHAGGWSTHEQRRKVKRRFESGG